MENELNQFLDFLASDISACPERLKAIDYAFLGRLRSLTDRVEVDLNAPLPSDNLAKVAPLFP